MMTDDLISSKKMAEDFEECNDRSHKWTPERVKVLIYRQPNMDSAPVVHGRWIEQDKYTFGVMYDCSICGNRILDSGHSWNYCPNCGAKMDLEG